MPRYFFHFGWWKLNNVFSFLLFSLFIVIYIYLRPNPIDSPTRTLIDSPNPTPPPIDSSTPTPSLTPPDSSTATLSPTPPDSSTATPTSSTSTTSTSTDSSSTTTTTTTTTASTNSSIPLIYIYLRATSSLSKGKIRPRSSSLLSNIRTHDFRRYPESRSAIEYNRIQIDDIAKSIFFYHENETDKNIDYSKPLKYSETIFRSASFPIIWLDDKGDVHWNRAAQHEFLNYLLEKQFPNDDISTCLSRQLFILEQWTMGGFFSRHHSLIDHFGQTLYSPSMALPSFKRFALSHAPIEDFHNEGILRYFQSISLCLSHINHPQLKTLHDHLLSFVENSSDTKIITNIYQLLERDETTIKYKFSRKIWKFGYDHVPHRRWLFDRNRKEIKNILNYHSSIKLLINHSNEHIYYNSSPSLDLTGWRPRNGPHQDPSDVLNGTIIYLTIPDQIFTSFLRYMFLLFFSQLAPRIQILAKLLAHHWSEYLSDKYNQPYNETLSKMAVLFIRRGDKMNEDTFWKKHQRWRNISLYVKGIIDEEKRRQIKYTTIFVMTDDVSVMNSIQEYSRVGLTGLNTDESYARQHLYDRQILYNVFAPQSCFDPFIRIGFDQFLVNIQFVTDYASLVVGHTDSNVGRYLEEIIYVNRQHKPNVQTQTYVVNAPDSLEKNS